MDKNRWAAATFLWKAGRGILVVSERKKLQRKWGRALSITAFIKQTKSHYARNQNKALRERERGREYIRLCVANFFDYLNSSISINGVWQKLLCSSQLPIPLRRSWRSCDHFRGRHRAWRDRYLELLPLCLARVPQSSSEFATREEAVEAWRVRRSQHRDGRIAAGKHSGLVQDP